MTIYKAIRQCMVEDLMDGSGAIRKLEDLATSLKLMSRNSGSVNSTGGGEWWSSGS